MHKEKVISKLHSNVNQKNAMFAPKPDYGNLLSKKYGYLSESDTELEEDKNGKNAPNKDKADKDGQGNSHISDTDSYEDDD